MTRYRNAVAGMAVAALLTFLPAAFAKKHQHQSASRVTTDNSFATMAAEDSIAQGHMADLAMQKTSNPHVKDLAQRLEADHHAANSQLKQIAAKQNLALPDKMSATNQAEYNRLSSLSGPEFDKEYVRWEARAHKTAIADYRREAEHGADPELKAFATDTLPKLEHHEEMARSIEPAVAHEAH
jgi:putative membrane protein